jgi:hypothetical protein
MGWAEHVAHTRFITGALEGKNQLVELKIDGIIKVYRKEYAMCLYTAVNWMRIVPSRGLFWVRL